MSVRQSLLALLREGPRYGALLKADFEARTGGVWPLNVGQVYTTLARLERDGLVVGDGKPDEEGRIAYRLTEAGRAEADSWWLAPVGVAEPARDELVIKLALAIATPTVDPYAVIQTQRGATMRHLQELTRLKVALTAPLTAPPASIGVDPELLVLEHRLFAVEAQLRWLDHAEASLAANPAPRHTHAAAPTAQPAPINGAITRVTAPPISHPAHNVPTGGTP
jgi:DNA-binding PadR family transcriptional regulator